MRLLPCLFIATVLAGCQTQTQQTASTPPEPTRPPTAATALPSEDEGDAAALQARGQALQQRSPPDHQAALAVYDQLFATYGLPSGTGKNDAILAQALLESGRAAASLQRPRNDRAITAFDKVFDTYAASPAFEFRRLALQAGLEKTKLLLNFTPPHTGLAVEIAHNIIQKAETSPSLAPFKLTAIVYKLRALALRSPLETHEINTLTQEGLSLAETLRAAGGTADADIETTPLYAELLFRDAKQKANRQSPDAALAAIARLIDSSDSRKADPVSRRYLIEARMLRATLLTAAASPRWADVATDYRAIGELAKEETLPDVVEQALLAQVKLGEIAPRLGTRQIEAATEDLTAIVRDRDATPHVGIRKATAQAFVVLSDFALHEKPPAPTKSISYLIGLERYANERMNEEMRYYWVLALTKRAKILLTYYPEDQASAFALYNQAEQWVSMTKATRERDILVAQAALDYAEGLMAATPPRRAEALSVLNRAQTLFSWLRIISIDPLFARLAALRTKTETGP